MVKNTHSGFHLNSSRYYDAALRLCQLQMHGINLIHCKRRTFKLGHSLINYKILPCDWTFKSKHRFLPDQKSRVTKKGWLTRSCVIKVCMQSLCGDFDFPAFSGDGTYLWSWPCIPWQAGAVAPFCSGWWLSNFSPRLHQAPSSWVTTVGRGEKALMWKQPLLYLISPLNHIKEM